MFPILIQSLKGRFSQEQWKSLKKVNRVIEIAERDLDSLHFIKKKEFIYEGKLYDIIKQKKEGSKLVFYCYHDKEEEKANEDFRTNTNRKKKGNITQIAVFTFFATEEILEYTCLTDRKLLSYRHLLSNYNSYISNVPFPPPRNIS